MVCFFIFHCVTVQAENSQLGATRLVGYLSPPILAVLNCAISWNRKITSQGIMFILFIESVIDMFRIELVNV